MCVIPKEEKRNGERSTFSFGCRYIALIFVIFFYFLGRYSGLHSLAPVTATGSASDLVLTTFTRKLSFSFKVDGRVRATRILGEGDEDETARKMSRCFHADEEFDLDHPAEGFSSIPEAIDDIRRGKVALCS